jgi:hypothetical protein
LFNYDGKNYIIWHDPLIPTIIWEEKGFKGEVGRWEKEKWPFVEYFYAERESDRVCDTLERIGSRGTCHGPS